MNILLVGNGKLASAIAKACQEASIPCFRDIEAFRSDPQDDTIAVHCGSGRQIKELVDCCVECPTPLIQASTMIRTADYSAYGLFMLDAPNTSLQIVYMMLVLPKIIKALTGLGMTLKVIESHQAGKKDTSGTARGILTAAGLPHDFIEAVRDPRIQKDVYGVPEAFLDGHAYHLFTFTGPGDIEIQISTKVHGRETYALGVLALAKKLKYVNRWPQTYALAEVFPTIIN
jgi:dihydrodipicolinate reductase